VQKRSVPSCSRGVTMSAELSSSSASSALATNQSFGAFLNSFRRFTKFFHKTSIENFHAEGEGGKQTSLKKTVVSQILLAEGRFSRSSSQHDIMMSLIPVGISSGMGGLWGACEERAEEAECLASFSRTHLVSYLRPVMQVLRRIWKEFCPALTKSS